MNPEQALINLEDGVSISDNIIINFNCPDSNGCYLRNPYKFNNFTIYYVNRNYSGNVSKYEKKTYDSGLKIELDKAIKNACLNPSQENLDIVEKIRLNYNNSISYTDFFYSDATPILSIGSDNFPVWVENDIDNSQVLHITKDEEDNEIFGKFQYIWTPLGMREGDYFLCWNWSPEIDGQILSDHIHFNLNGNTVLTTSIPTHNTQKNKYETLLEKYTPEMFKTRMGSKDLTPETIQELNMAVAKGFTYLEDMSNHILDLNDANSTHESFLQLFAGLFGIKLRTNDPTLWRRQIKEAVSLSKKKGTHIGLKEALHQSGILLNKFTRLWQVTSKYTYQEVFNYEGEDQFTLSNISLNINSDNFELYIRKNDSLFWDNLSLSNISISNDDNGNMKILNWEGSDLSLGDSIRIIYQINEVPTVDEQTNEDYTRLLPLADSRDERSQDYPLKNWNVRVIEEDDPMFNLIITKRNLDFEKLIFGKIRTEFPYSENIYNMDSYNGSTRDSQNPCDIDKNLIDPCHSCLSSKFTVDLEIDQISNDRILEAQDVIKEFVPFHAVLHSMNLSGGVTEYVKPALEKIDALINFNGNEFTVTGSAQNVFNRSMYNSSELTRSILADSTVVVSNASVVGYNENITMYSSSINYNNFPINKNKDWTYLKISGPSLNQGIYKVEDANKHSIKVSGTFYLPLDKNAFNYKLSNIVAKKSNISIYKDNYITFTDSSNEFDKIKTEWDVINNVDYLNALWKIQFSSYGTFDIINILPNNIILLNYDSSLPTSNTNSLSYNILNDDNEIVFSGTTGSLKIVNRGRVDFSGSINVNDTSVTLTSMKSLMDSYKNNGANHYFFYDNEEYEFFGFVKDAPGEFYIKNWTASDFSGSADVMLLQRIVDNDKGYFQYNGFYINTSPINFESDLPIQNGINSSGVLLENDTFKENYLVKIDSNYYSIFEIDEYNIYLRGPQIECSLNGNNLNIDIINYSKLSFSVEENEYSSIPSNDFQQIDRRGKDIITGNMPELFSLALNTNDDQIVEKVDQNENINFIIKNSDGEIIKGNI